MTDWTVTDIPFQDGRTAVITGATGGLGFETALALAGAGAKVVADRPKRRQGGAMPSRKSAGSCPMPPSATKTLDLANLASVADFAARFCRRPRLARSVDQQWPA